jgi:sulfide:quinone oxidoreductase
MRTTPRVVVAGGGFAGLETAFYLRHRLHGKVGITLVSDRDYFLFKPNTIYIPFGEDPAKFRIPIEPATHRKQIDFIQAPVRSIDPVHHTIHAGDRDLAYDYAVLATGAEMRASEIPGLQEHAITVWTPDEMLRLRAAYQKLVENARSRASNQRLLFLIPPNNRCAGPLYEMVLMTDTWLREQGVRGSIEMNWATFESTYIQAFGPRLNTAVSEEFDRRGIWGHREFVANHIEPGAVHFKNGEHLVFDLLVSFPPYIAHTSFPSLPHDERGFIPVDADSRRVKGQDRIFAVGDAANFPVKQAFLALLQADAAAEHIAAEIEHRSPEVVFEPMSMCVMEEFDKATFAQVPLVYTGDEARPVRVDVEDTDHYKVGVSPLWRYGKKLLGLYLPWRFGHGEPFHAGLAWKAMDKGLKVMSSVLAE